MQDEGFSGEIIICTIREQLNFTQKTTSVVEKAKIV